MKLFLSGGGDAADSRLLDELFVSNIPADKKSILYIPLAWKSGIYDGCLKWFTSTFGVLGDFKIEMWTTLDNKTNEDLNDFGAIYIGGGNTYLLLAKLKQSGFDSLLKNFIDSGGIVYGGSAGAIILGNNISTALIGQDADENIVGLTDLSGLNLINDFAIQCHFQDNQINEIKAYSVKNKVPIIALPERTGLYIADDQAKVVGYEPADIIQITGEVARVYPGDLLFNH